MWKVSYIQNLCDKEIKGLKALPLFLSLLISIAQFIAAGGNVF